MRGTNGGIPDITGGRATYERRPVAPPFIDRNTSGLLTVEDVQAIYRLSRIIHVDLARRSAPLLQPADFDRIGRLLDAYVTRPLDIDRAVVLHRAITLSLVRPAASGPELRTLAFLQRRINQHYQVGMRLHGLLPADYSGRGEVHYGAFELFRLGDPDAGERAALDMSSWAQSVTLWMTRGQVAKLA
jgi:DNA-binding GntR family transcriptional regulator